MASEEKIKKAINEQLEIEDQKQYADLLINRIEENRKTMSRLSITLFFCIFAFPLITESKISDISLGPFKLNDSLIALGLIPSIFAFTYYKYITVWIDLVEQKMTYKVLVSEIFSFKPETFLNQKIWPYSFLDSIMMHHLKEDSKSLGCITMLFWIPIGLILILFPFVFEYYTIHTLYNKFGLDTFLKKTVLFLPALMGLSTIHIIIQVIRKDFNDKKYGFQKNDK